MPAQELQRKAEASEDDGFDLPSAGPHSRAAVRASGSLCWTGGADLPAADAPLGGCQAALAAASVAAGPSAALYLHSAPAKDHLVTAKLVAVGPQADGSSAGPVSLGAPSHGVAAAVNTAFNPRLAQLLYRGEVGTAWRVLLAPLGGCLQAIAPPLAAAGALGSTSLLKRSQGGGEPHPDVHGTGAAACYSQGALSIAFGGFVHDAYCDGAAAGGAPLQPRRRCGAALEVSVIQPDTLSISIALSHDVSVSRPDALGGIAQRPGVLGLLWGIDSIAPPRRAAAGAAIIPEATPSTSAGGAAAAGAAAVTAAEGSAVARHSETQLSVAASYNHADCLVLSGSLCHTSLGRSNWAASVATHPDAPGWALSAALGSAAGGSGLCCELAASRQVVQGLFVKPCLLLLPGNDGRGLSAGGAAMQTVLKF